MMFLRALALLLALSGSALAQSGQIPSGTVWGNSGASKAIASPATFTAMFDRALGSTTGAVIARSAATWGLVSGTTTQLLHGNAAGSPSFGQLVAADVTTNTLTNATLAQAAASTLKGNPTTGTANVQDFTLIGLTSKATPVGADTLLLSDSAASNAFKRATVTAVLAAAPATVTSIAGNTGAFTLSTGITNSTNDIRLDRGQLPGETTTGSAAAGNIGEHVTANATPALTTATAANITSITLTAGDWDISGQVQFSGAGATNTTDVISAISTTTATVSAALVGLAAHDRQAGILDFATPHTLQPTRVSISGSTTYYLNAQATFTISTYQAAGVIRARRVR